MKKDTYKILVLSDLKASTDAILKSTIRLAKIIQGDISFFHVKSPASIVKKESQLSAIRALNEEHITIDKKIQELTLAIFKEYNVNINYTFTFGNVRHEIYEYIQKHKPDIIVLGKKKSSTFNLMGDNLTDLVLREHLGEIMIVADENTIQPNEMLSLGVYDGIKNELNIPFANDLMAHTEQPLKSFEIAPKKPNVYSKDKQTDDKLVTYVFEPGDAALASISKYLIQNRINLLYVDRDRCASRSSVLEGSTKFTLKDITNHLNVSLLLTSKTIST